VESPGVGKSGDLDELPNFMSRMRPGKKSGSAYCLFIDIAPVRDPRHIDDSSPVVNDVNYSIIADTDPPFLIAAPEFFAAGRPGNLRQMFKTRHNAGHYLCRQPAQFLFRACG
jgi:hypothetical protein